MRFFADRAQISGWGTVATQRDSSSFQWHIPVSSFVAGPPRPAPKFGDVRRNFKFPVAPPCVKATGESVSWGSFMPARAKDVS